MKKSSESLRMTSIRGPQESHLRQTGTHGVTSINALYGRRSFCPLASNQPISSLFQTGKAVFGYCLTVASNFPLTPLFD